MAGQKGKKPRYRVQEVLEAIEGTYGIKTIIARKLGCHRVTVNRYLKRHPRLAEAVREEREKLKDLAEAKLIEQLQDGQPWAVKYVLSTLGKDRGYVERQEHVVSGLEGGAPISIDRGCLSKVLADPEGRKAIEKIHEILQGNSGPSD
ncbi:MAG: hypothetical protein DRG40_00300 [Deltaproteobacteria bacterium]|nr:MAG: hypothetical protein DRG40_00300 [Deltaproteobacteria bacterium]